MRARTPARGRHLRVGGGPVFALVAIVVALAVAAGLLTGAAAQAEVDCPSDANGKRCYQVPGCVYYSFVYQSKCRPQCSLVFERDCDRARDCKWLRAEGRCVRVTTGPTRAPVHVVPTSAPTVVLAPVFVSIGPRNPAYSAAGAAGKSPPMAQWAQVVLQVVLQSINVRDQFARQAVVRPCLNAKDEQTSAQCKLRSMFLNANEYDYEAMVQTRSFIVYMPEAALRQSPDDPAKLIDNTRRLLRDEFELVAFDVHVPFLSNGPGSAQPNIVLLLADDLGYGDVGYQSCAGNEYKGATPERGAREPQNWLCTPKGLTKNIDALAAAPSTVVFSRFLRDPIMRAFPRRLAVGQRKRARLQHWEHWGIQ